MKNNKNVYILINDYTYTHSFVAYGVNIAKQLKAPAVIFVLENLTYPIIPPVISATNIPGPAFTSTEVIERKIKPIIRKVCLEMRQIWKNVDYEIAESFPESKALKISKEKEPYLFVVRNKSNLNKFNEWFGTYETRIAKKADYPVLIVQPHYVWHPIKKILYIMDAEDSKVENMRILALLAKQFGAHVQVVIISEKKVKPKDKLVLQMADVFNKILGYNEASFYRTVGAKNAKEVLDVIGETKPDWFAFEAKNKNFFERLFDNYNTKRLVLQSQIPVLVL